MACPGSKYFFKKAVNQRALERRLHIQQLLPVTLLAYRFLGVTEFLVLERALAGISVTGSVFVFFTLHSFLLENMLARFFTRIKFK